MKLETLNIPALLDLSKADFQSKANQISDLVLDGFIDPLDMDIRLKAMSEIIDIARKTIKPNLIAKVERDHTKEIQGCKIALRNGSEILDYEFDAEYVKLKQSLAARKELLDLAYDMKLKGLEAFHPETGEVTTVVPVKSYTASSISYTFKK